MNNQEIIEMIQKTESATFKIDGLGETTIPTKKLEFLVDAHEKQIPKKVYHFLDDDTFITTCCDYDVTNEDYDYCPNCGQLLGDVEEVEG